MIEGERSQVEARPFHYGFVVLGMSFLVVTGALGFARFGYTMILPFMKTGLELNYTETGLLATGNFVGYLSFALIGGVLAAKYGARVIIGLGMAVAGAAMFFTGLAPGFALALVGRVVTGAGSGASNVPAMGLISSWFGPSRRGMAAGVVTGGSGFGLVIGGPLIPFIVSSYNPGGWRFAWYYLGGLTFLLGVLGYLYLRNRPAEKGLTAIGLAPARVYGLAESQAPGNWRAIYRSPALWQLGLAFWLYGFSYVIYTTFFAAYLTQEVGLKPGTAGSIWALVGILSLGSGVIWGGLSDWLGRKYGLLIAFLLQALSFAFFSLSGDNLHVYGSAILFGITAWSIPAIIGASAGDYLGPRLAPAALGLMTLFTGFGQGVGPAVGGLMADASHSFTPAFAAAAVAALLGAATSLLLKPPASPS